MSERKTAEIKFRVEPSAKARWQALADTQGKPLSELIRDRMDAPLELPTSRVSGFAEFIEVNEPTDFYGGPDFEASGVADIAVPVATHEFVHGGTTSEGGFINPVAAAPQADVSTSGEVGAKCERGCKSWEFCACKAFEDSVTR